MSQNPAGNALLKDLLAKRSDQHTKLAAAMRPFSEAIAVLDGQIESLEQAHMAEVSGVKLGADVSLRDGRKARVTSYMNYLPLALRDRLPTKAEIGIRLSILKVDGRVGRFGVVRHATDFVTDGTILVA